GKIEDTEDAGEVLAIDEGVHRPSRNEIAAEQLVRLAADVGVELPRDGDEGIPRPFKIEPLPVHLPEEEMLRITRQGVRPVEALLLPRCREEHLQMEILEGPAAADEIA